MTSNEPITRYHLLVDLEPYTCVLQDCPDPDRTYANREDWEEHIKFAHGKTWRCCFGCPVPLPSSEAFDSHLRAEHGGLFAEAELPTLRDMCEKHVMPDDNTRYPLCLGEPSHWPEQHNRQQHIGSHLEEIALQILRPGAFEARDAAAAPTSAAIEASSAGIPKRTKGSATPLKEPETSKSGFTGWVSSQPLLPTKSVSQPPKPRTGGLRRQEAQDFKEEKPDSLYNRDISQRSFLAPSHSPVEELSAQHQAQASEAEEARRRNQQRWTSTSDITRKLATYPQTPVADASREAHRPKAVGNVERDVWASYLEGASSESEAEEKSENVPVRPERPDDAYEPRSTDAPSQFSAQKAYQRRPSSDRIGSPRPFSFGSTLPPTTSPFSRRSRDQKKQSKSDFSGARQFDDTYGQHWKAEELDAGDLLGQEDQLSSLQRRWEEFLTREAEEGRGSEQDEIARL